MPSIELVVYYGVYIDAQNAQKCSRPNSSLTAHSLRSSSLMLILVAVASGARCSGLSSFNMHAELCPEHVGHGADCEATNQDDGGVHD